MYTIKSTTLKFYSNLILIDKLFWQPSFWHTGEVLKLWDSMTIAREARVQFDKGVKYISVKTAEQFSSK